MADTEIDPQVFADLQDAVGDEFAAELVETFLSEAPGMLADLKDAEARNDSEAFRRAAHSIKSNAATFGALQLFETARGLELDGPSPGSIDQVEAEFLEAEAALRKVLND